MILVISLTVLLCAITLRFKYRSADKFDKIANKSKDQLAFAKALRSRGSNVIVTNAATQWVDMPKVDCLSGRYKSIGTPYVRGSLQFEVDQYKWKAETDKLTAAMKAQGNTLDNIAQNTRIWKESLAGTTHAFKYKK